MRADRFIGELVAVGGRRASVGRDIFRTGKFPPKIVNPPAAVGNATTTIGNGAAAVGKRPTKIGKLEFLTGKSLLRIGKTIFQFINPTKIVETVQPPIQTAPTCPIRCRCTFRSGENIGHAAPRIGGGIDAMLIAPPGNVRREVLSLGERTQPR